MPVAPATLVLPTPPFPAKSIMRISLLVYIWPTIQNPFFTHYLNSKGYFVQLQRQTYENMDRNEPLNYEMTKIFNDGEQENGAKYGFKRYCSDNHNSYA